MGVTGIHPQTGLTTGDFEEAGVKRALANAAAEVYVLASAEKLNAASPYAVVELSQISGIVTEAGVSDQIVQPYTALGIKVIRA